LTFSVLIVNIFLGEMLTCALTYFRKLYIQCLKKLKKLFFQYKTYVLILCLDH